MVGVLVAGADVDGLVDDVLRVDGVLRLKSQVGPAGSTKVGSCLIWPAALSPLPTTKLPATTVQLGASCCATPFMATIEFLIDTVELLPQLTTWEAGLASMFL